MRLRGLGGQLPKYGADTCNPKNGLSGGLGQFTTLEAFSGVFHRVFGLPRPRGATFILTSGTFFWHPLYKNVHQGVVSECHIPKFSRAAPTRPTARQ